MLELLVLVESYQVKSEGMNFIAGELLLFINIIYLAV